MKYTTIAEINDAKEIISPPGDTLAETIQQKGITQQNLATRMGRPLKTVNEIIKGKAAILPETALQLELVLGIPASFWMEREKLYRLELAEIEMAERIMAEKDWVSQFPLSAMKKMNWIDFQNDIVSKTNAILTFFGVSGKQAYEQYHALVYQQAYRMTASNNKDPYSVAAWLRQGERQAEKIKTNEYDRQAFKGKLEQIKLLMAAQPVDFFPNLRALCAEAGVKVVCTPCLPKTKLHGSTRWFNDKPIIQLSNLYARNDIFWFTFFHEAGHIILHGKRNVFLEGLHYSAAEQAMEDEANEFATGFTLTHEQEKEIRAALPLSRNSLSQFAAKYKTHPAMIVGRFAKEHEPLGWQLNIFEKVNIISDVL